MSYLTNVEVESNIMPVLLVVEKNGIGFMSVLSFYLEQFCII
jgi:hypothetical protein